ncbi:hypothetical protein BYT27DRAFT_7263491 [Phlegmacium glaucopus]|nr:hypothetical protein BYT27DRAFT_7263491 [Phlegmacium glaucopus]
MEGAAGYALMMHSSIFSYLRQISKVFLLQLMQNVTVLRQQALQDLLIVVAKRPIASRIRTTETNPPIDVCPSVCSSSSATTHTPKGLSSPTTDLPLPPNHLIQNQRRRQLISQWYFLLMALSASSHSQTNPSGTNEVAHSLVSPVSPPAEFVNVTEKTKLAQMADVYQQWRLRWPFSLAHSKVWRNQQHFPARK